MGEFADFFILIKLAALICAGFLCRARSLRTRCRLATPSLYSLVNFMRRSCARLSADSIDSAHLVLASMHSWFGSHDTDKKGIVKPERVSGLFDDLHSCRQHRHSAVSDTVV